MSNTLKPARAIVPGHIVQRELDSRGWTQRDLAEIMNRPTQTINEIIKGRKRVTPETARELAAAFGTSAQFWISLESNYRLHFATQRQKENEIERRSRLYSLAPIADLIKYQWIKPGGNLEELELSVCEFLGINSLADNPQLSFDLPSDKTLEPEYISTVSWCKRVEKLASKKKLTDFNLDAFQAAIPDLLNYSQKEEDVAKVPPFLNDLGVNFVIVPHLKNSDLDGAAFYFDNNPVIALTLRHDRIDNFWFTLMHELGHIASGHQNTYLDNLENLDKTSEELEASNFARQWLINEESFNSFITEQKPKFTGKVITNFALQQNRHPGIILSRLHHEELVPHRKLRKFLVKVEPFLSPWIDC